MLHPIITLDDDKLYEIRFLGVLKIPSLSNIADRFQYALDRIRKYTLREQLLPMHQII